MVPVRLESLAVRALRAAFVAGALTLAACARHETGAGAASVGDTSVAATALMVKAQYTSTDAEAAGAWSWTSPAGRVFVLVDVQSTVQGIVQARAELWTRDERGVFRIGQSDALPSAAEIGGYAFEDLTGDSLPDLFGYVADSAGESYPVFMPGALGALGEEITVVAPGWRFELDEDHLPSVVRSSAGGACALQLWAATPAPDDKPEGWRWLPILPGRATEVHLGEPAASQPDCDVGSVPKP